MAQFPHILLIDDQLSNLIALEQTLSAIDVVIHKAVSGESALGMLLDETIDCILVDVSMPRMDGFEFLQTLRADSELQHIPVVMITGKIFSANEVMRAYQCGAFDFLTKPIDGALLCRKVNYLAATALHYRQIQSLKGTLNGLARELIMPLELGLQQQTLDPALRTSVEQALYAAQELQREWDALNNA
ncbi:MAG: response regulator [Gammaproteobacteria bacterium]